MERLTKRILPTAVAVGAGIVTLAGYLVPYGPLAQLRDQIVGWAVIVAAFAFVLGFFNLLGVHLARLTRRKPGWPYSVALILTALVSLVVTAAGLLTPRLRLFSDWWFGYVLFPLQASAAGLVAFALSMAAFRLMRSRRSAWGLWFLLTALVVLLGTVPLPHPIGGLLADLREWWMGVLALAGMRGLLIGVGLGTLVMGLRVLVGLDRPHSDV